MNIEELTKNIKKKTIFQMDDHIFDQIVNEFYGMTDFSLVADQELGNDSSYVYNTSNNSASYDKETLKNFKNNEFVSFVAPVLFNDLCSNGVLEEGEYVINISW